MTNLLSGDGSVNLTFTLLTFRDGAKHHQLAALRTDTYALHFQAKGQRQTFKVPRTATGVSI